MPVPCPVLPISLVRASKNLYRLTLTPFRLTLAGIDDDDSVRERVELLVQYEALSTDIRDYLAAALAKVRDRLEVREQAVR